MISSPGRDDCVEVETKNQTYYYRNAFFCRNELGDIMIDGRSVPQAASMSRLTANIVLFFAAEGSSRSCFSHWMPCLRYEALAGREVVANQLDHLFFDKDDSLLLRR